MGALQIAGGAAFGMVVGWTTYFILRRAQPKALTDITTFVGSIGGAAVTGLFDSKGDVFAGYAIGLAIGFFSYFIAFRIIMGDSAIREMTEKGTGGILGRDPGRGSGGTMGRDSKDPRTREDD